jgi:hypothetical protein
MKCEHITLTTLFNQASTFLKNVSGLNMQYCHYTVTPLTDLQENQRDIQTPIKFQLKYQLVQKEPPRFIQGQPLPNIDDYPVLNQQEATKIFQATFQNDCADEICVSQLYLETLLLLPSGNYYWLMRLQVVRLCSCSPVLHVTLGCEGRLISTW